MGLSRSDLRQKLVCLHLGNNESFLTAPSFLLSSRGCLQQKWFVSRVFRFPFPFVEGKTKTYPRPKQLMELNFDQKIKEISQILQTNFPHETTKTKLRELTISVSLSLHPVGYSKLLIPLILSTQFNEYKCFRKVHLHEGDYRFFLNFYKLPDLQQKPPYPITYRTFDGRP